jgi:hypothetical protein
MSFTILAMSKCNALDVERIWSKWEKLEKLEKCEKCPKLVAWLD